MIFVKLMLSFIKIGFIAFGGGYAAISLIQDEIVTTHNWLTITEYLDIISLSQMTPGPIAINTATFVGFKIGGLSGAFIATFSIVLPSLLLIYLLVIFNKKIKTSQLFKNSINCAVIILILTAGVKLLLSIVNTYFSYGGVIDILEIIPFIVVASLTLVLLNLKKKIKIYWIVLIAGSTSTILNFII